MRVSKPFMSCIALILILASAIASDVTNRSGIASQPRRPTPSMSRCQERRQLQSRREVAQPGLGAAGQCLRVSRLVRGR